MQQTIFMNKGFTVPRINLDKLAAEYGLEIEKNDVGRYKQWKDAEVMLFLPGHAGTQAIVWGEYPPKGSIFIGINTNAYATTPLTNAICVK